MVYRYVLMRFRADATSFQKQEVVRRQQRFGDIPDVIWLHAGIDISPTERLPFTHGLLVCFVDEGALSRYEQHPSDRRPDVSRSRAVAPASVTGRVISVPFARTARRWQP
jgi:hypothetical protein